MKNVILLCSLVFLTACTAVDPCKDLQKDLVPSHSPRVVLDTALLDYCGDLPKLTESSYTQQQALDILKTWIYQYKFCQKKHSLLSDWAKQASGTNNIVNK